MRHSKATMDPPPALRESRAAFDEELVVQNRIAQRVRRAEYRALRVWRDGRLVAPVAEEHHGRLVTYTDRACRCRRCTDAKRDYGRAYRIRVKEREDQQS